MSHYFINDSTLDSNIKSYDVEINATSFRFYTDRGVFSKETLDYGTKFLLETIELNKEVKTVIDMGCGYGPIGLYVAKTSPEKHVYLYDVNERAVALALKNMKENEITNAEVHQSFLFEYVNIKADAIITNPPIRAGKPTIFRLYEDAYLALNPGGILYVVIQKKQGAPSTVAKLHSLFNNCDVVDKSKGYWVLLAKK
ncbi:MAG: methyltransferase [Acholeplasmataceae bacterium]|nr:methyltransferase [Acholeplasmataceae bacterium]